MSSSDRADPPSIPPMTEAVEDKEEKERRLKTLPPFLEWINFVCLPKIEPLRRSMLGNNGCFHFLRAECFFWEQQLAKIVKENQGKLPLDSQEMKEAQALYRHCYHRLREFRSALFKLYDLTPPMDWENEILSDRYHFGVLISKEDWEAFMEIGTEALFVPMTEEDYRNAEHDYTELANSIKKIREEKSKADAKPILESKGVEESKETDTLVTE